MKPPSSLSTLCLVLGLLGGCKDDESELPPPAAKPAPVAQAPASNEPPPFTAPDSSPQAQVEDGAAQAPQFTPPTTEAGAAPQRSQAKPASKATPGEPTAASTSSTAAVVPSTQGEWVLQVGIHKTEDGAQSLADKLKAKGFPAYVLKVSTAGTGLSGSYFRVRVGAFATREDALRYGENVLKPAGLKDFWADKKSNEAKAREAQLPTP